MRPSAHAEAAALRWEESVAREECAREPRPPVRRPAAEPTRSAIADGAAIRRLDLDADDEAAAASAA
jgi:hypothetical protein